MRRAITFLPLHGFMAWKGTTLSLPFIPNLLGGNGPLSHTIQGSSGHLKTDILSGDGNI
jgi:hypothetical protein